MILWCMFDVIGQHTCILHHVVVHSECQVVVAPKLWGVFHSCYLYPLNEYYA